MRSFSVTIAIAYLHKTIQATQNCSVGIQSIRLCKGPRRLLYLEIDRVQGLYRLRLAI